jgi:hypothetical protein
VTETSSPVRLLKSSATTVVLLRPTRTVRRRTNDVSRVPDNPVGSASVSGAMRVVVILPSDADATHNAHDPGQQCSAQGRTDHGRDPLLRCRALRRCDCSIGAS